MTVNVQVSPDSATIHDDDSKSSNQYVGFFNTVTENLSICKLGSGLLYI